MNDMRVAIFIVCGLAALTSACTTIVSSVPFTGTEKGLRYSLPEPYLLVKPKPDGTLDYQWINLKDSKKEYVLTASSFLSTYKLEANVENSFLKDVSFNGDSSNTASKAATAFGEVAAARKTAEIAADKAQEKAATDKLAAAEKVSQDQLTALDKLIADAATEEAATAAEDAFYQTDAGKGASDAAKLAAKLALQKTRAKLADYRARKESLLATDGAKDAGTAGTPAVQAWGAVLYKVIQTEGGGVVLREVIPQVKYDTYVAPQKVPAAAAKPGVELTAGTVAIAGGATVVNFTSSVAVKLTKDGKLELNKDTDVYKASTAVYTDGKDDKNFSVAFKPVLPSGAYSLQITYTAKTDGAKSASTALVFTVP